MAARRAQTPKASAKKAATKEKDTTGSSRKTVRLEGAPDRTAKTRAKKPAAEAPAKRAKVEAKRPSGAKKPAEKQATKKPAEKAVPKKPTAKKPAAKKPAAKKPATKSSTTAGGRAETPAPKQAPAEAFEQTEARDGEAGAPPSSAEQATRSPATERSPSENDGVPAASPSERLLAARADAPAERPLTDEEREAMAKVSETARRYVGAEGEPRDIVGTIASFVEEVRAGKREEPKSQDVRLGLGVLWGEQLRAQVGWRWVHLTYPDGFASYALVPDDRAFACFPLNRVPEAFHPSGPNTSAHVFDSIREGSLPARKPNSYLVIG